MAMNDKMNHHIDTEFALQDAMDNICKYLVLADLSNLAKTCKSWRKSARREVAKRCHIKQLSFPYENNKPSESWAPVLASSLDVNPHVSVLFFNNALYERLMDESPYVYLIDLEIIRNFKSKLHNKVILVRVCEHLTTEDVQYQVQAGSRDVLGLFLPSVKRRVSVDVAWEHCDIYGHLNAICLAPAHRIADKLGLHDCDRSQSVLLMFAYSMKGLKIANVIADNSVMEGKETIWAAGFHKQLLISDRVYNRFSAEQGIVVLRISGPSIQAWTAVIDYSELYEIERKLGDLKERVKPKRYTTGLLSAPSKGSNHEIMRMLKHVFPNIPFTGLFNSWNEVLKTENELNGNKDLCYTWHRNLHISIIIIAYD